MKNFLKKSYLIGSLIIVASAIVIPILVFSWNGIFYDKYLIPNGDTLDNVVSIYGNNCKIYNHSGKNLFIPNKTNPEWLSVRKFATSTNGVDIWCCNDGAQGIYGEGVCNVADNNENCTNCPSDCGSCATCTDFTYSDWGPCTDGQQTRTVASSEPDLCTGGNPDLTQACACGTMSGCDSGQSCFSGNYFDSSPTCSGFSHPYSGTCFPNGTPNCMTTGPNTSMTTVVLSGSYCTHYVTCPTPIAGCRTGYVCVSGRVSLSSPTCQNLEAPGGPSCLPNTINYNCNVTGTSNTSYIYTATTGCTYTP